MASTRYAALAAPVSNLPISRHVLSMISAFLSEYRLLLFFIMAIDLPLRPPPVCISVMYEIDEEEEEGHGRGQGGGEEEGEGEEDVGGKQG